MNVRIIIFSLIIISLLVACGEANKDKIEQYKSNFNPTREEVGLLPFDDRWDIIPFSERNAFLCNDSSIVTMAFDTINMLNKGFYAGKALLFNDDDSLDCSLCQEVDRFIINRRDSEGKLIRNELLFTYTFKTLEGRNEEIGMDYSLMKQEYDKEASDPYFKTYYTSEKLTKEQADSVLLNWRIY